ncbi:helix-turn-helix domain-containing protein [Falsibacillus albus]|uniref:Helix-turn-helix domain-containing protein n=1 Tax=Falsibacillus albus TaxID=2478915 RepID=A0A3L7K159_9BACI|nr:helix-turn-helix domain-containing protein [Falsibacillus albus]RLQ96817.1 helix-turn-helix domain-containing protein [Falsibacillus albus]
MDFFAVGSKIKELRKLIGLSQEELAEGICTQAQISKIEKGDVYPYASTLYLISQKLGVDVNYFFDIGMTPRVDYVQEVSSFFKAARKNHQYDDILEIIKTEEKNPLFTQNTRNRQLLLWHKAICTFVTTRDRDEALRMLNEALELSQVTEKIWTEKEIGIYNSIGAIYSEDNEFEKALKVFQSAVEHLKLLPYISDYTLKPRVYYNIARMYTKKGEYDISINYCKEAIDYCIQKDNMHVLGELHYHLGYNYELQNKFMLAVRYLEKALLIFNLQKNDHYINFITEKIEALKKQPK